MVIYGALKSRALSEKSATNLTYHICTRIQHYYILSPLKTLCPTKNTIIIIAHIYKSYLTEI